MEQRTDGKVKVTTGAKGSSKVKNGKGKVARVTAKLNLKEKNKYGFVKGTRKDRYCQLIEQGKWGKDQILATVKREFGTASENAFSFFLRDLRLKSIKVERRAILSFKKKR